MLMYIIKFLSYLVLILHQSCDIVVFTPRIKHVCQRKNKRAVNGWGTGCKACMRVSASCYIVRQLGAVTDLPIKGSYSC